MSNTKKYACLSQGSSVFLISNLKQFSKKKKKTTYYKNQTEFTITEKNQGITHLVTHYFENFLYKTHVIEIW